MTTTSAPLSLIDGTISDVSSALLASLDRLSATAQNAMNLLAMSGNAGARGDTADDLRIALAMHGHLVHQFSVKVRTEAGTRAFNTQASSSYQAYQAAAESQGDTPCGISVTPAEPTQASLVSAHRALRIASPLDVALKNPALNVALHSYARKHSRRNAGPDIKRLAANDHD